MNPFGLLYEEVTASSLVRVDLEGNVISPGSTQLGVSQSGFSLHSAIHAARRHVKCVIHVHTTAGAAVSHNYNSDKSEHYEMVLKSCTNEVELGTPTMCILMLVCCLLTATVLYTKLL